jgi:ketosteroid isomerase-like protein
MAMTVREAFEKGTETFNAHDLDGFAEVLADDVVFRAPGGVGGQGKAACVAFFGSWFGAFPDAKVQVHALHLIDDVAVEEGTFSGTHRGVLHGPTGDVPPTGRSVSVDYLQVLRFRNGRHVSFNLLFDRLLMLEQLGLLQASPPADHPQAVSPVSASGKPRDEVRVASPSAPSPAA